MFVFYDTETTGLSGDFSQILQIALVLTDDDLNVISTKKLAARAAPWMVPTPGSLLTTHFDPEGLKKNKYSHYEMMKEVAAWIGQQKQPVTFAGYNSLGYDERVLAQNLSQNLLDHGVTTAGANVRMDIVIAVKVLAAYMPGALKMDIKNEYGTPSLSLMNVAKQNGVDLSANDAHDSLNDILATVGLAKVIRKTAPDVWDHLMKLGRTDGVDAFLSSHLMFTHTYSRTDGVAVATSLVENKAKDGARQLIFDLSIDPASYMKLSAQQLKAVLMTKGSKNPFRWIEKEKQPILMPMEASSAVLPKNYDEKVFEERARLLQSDPDFLKRLQDAASAARAAQAVTPKPLPELLIDDAVSPPLKARLQLWVREFHGAMSWEECAKMLDSFAADFKDDLTLDPSLARFPHYAARIVYENGPEMMSPEKREAIKKYIAGRLLNTDETAPYVTIAAARKELQQIEKERQAGKPKWAHVTDEEIGAIARYYDAVEKEYVAYAPPAPAPAPKPEAPKPAPPKPPGFQQ